MSLRKRTLDDMDGDIRDHIARETQDNIDRGMTPDEARYAALRKFGNVGLVKENTREVWRVVWLEQLMKDLRFSLRMLRKNPSFTVVAILTLALGIGANAAIFSLVRGVLLRPLVNRDESRLIYIRQSAEGIGLENATFSVPEIQDLRASVKTIIDFGEFSTMGFAMIGLGEPRVVRGGVVNGSYFEVMGLHPVLGRLLDKRDDGPKADGAVVFTHRFWSTVFKSDPSVIGKTIRLDSFGARSATIVGVVADLDDEHVIPGPIMTVYDPFEQFMFAGRLFVHTSVDPYSLVNPISRIVREMSADQPLERAATLADVRAEVLTPDRLNTFVFGGFALVALIIAVVGIAGVWAFSVSARTRELGIRIALGSHPRQLLSSVIAEGALMAGLGIVAGSLGGFALAPLAGSYFQRVQMPGAIVVVVSAFVLLAAAVIASALPAIRAARVDVIQTLRAE